MPRSKSTMRVATRFKKLRSWVMVMTLPLKAISRSSSHSIESKSRWLVGSSNKSTSGCDTNPCANATRFLLPPERVPMMASPFKCRRCSVSVMRCSQFQPSTASIWLCRASKSPVPVIYSSIKAIAGAIPTFTASKIVAFWSKSGSCDT